MLHLDQWKRWKAAWTSGAMILPMCTSSPQRFPWPSCSIPNLQGHRGEKKRGLDWNGVKVDKAVQTDWERVGGEEEQGTEKGGSGKSFSHNGWRGQRSKSVLRQNRPSSECFFFFTLRVRRCYYGNQLTHVQSHVPPQRQKRNHLHGSTCSSSPGGTCPSPGRNLGSRRKD